MEDPTAQQEEVADDSVKPEGLLYHYTDQKGLLGILENQSIRATHSQYLNDYSEYQIYLDAVGEIINRKLEGADGNFRARMLRTFLGARQREGVFVSSFSEGFKGDALTMWRAYSSDSGGYSIGFDRLALDSLAKSYFSYPRGIGYLDKCIYVDPESLDISPLALETIKIRIPGVIDFPEGFIGNGFDDPDGTISQTTNDMMLYVSVQASMAALMKHVGFHAEEEWRIVLVDESGRISRQVEFRQGKSQLVPYVKIRWKKEETSTLIRRIVVGPTPNKDDAVKAVKMLLEKLDVQIKSDDCPDGVDVVSSKIPYRNW
jgi:hypothetical protein